MASCHIHSINAQDDIRSRDKRIYITKLTGRNFTLHKCSDCFSYSANMRRGRWKIRVNRLRKYFVVFDSSGEFKNKKK